MKKTLLFFVMLTMVVGSAVAVAGDDNPTASSRMAVLRSGSTFKVFYKGGSINKVTINIYDSRGERVFSDHVGRLENFVRPYNFSGLAEGQYSIELVDNNGKQVESVEYRYGKIEKLATLIKVANEDGKYLLVVPSRGKDTLGVKIFDANGFVVYDGVEKVDGNFAKVYDLKALNSNFAFEITDKTGAIKLVRY
jgi:hypothetical protein